MISICNCIKYIIRYFILLSHYQSPLQVSEEGLLNAKKALEHIRAITITDKGPYPEGRDAFIAEMESDLKTPNAIAAIHALAAHGDLEALIEYGEILGIRFLPETSAPLSILQDIRAELRASKEFEIADMIRKKMVDADLTITDPPLRN